MAPPWKGGLVRTTHNRRDVRPLVGGLVRTTIDGIRRDRIEWRSGD